MMYRKDNVELGFSDEVRGGARWLPKQSGQAERAIARWECEGGRVIDHQPETDELTRSELKLRRLKALLVRLKALEVAVRIEKKARHRDDDHLYRLKQARLRVKDEIYALQDA